MNKHIITTVITQKYAQRVVIKHFLEENPILFGTEFLSWDNFVKFYQVPWIIIGSVSISLLSINMHFQSYRRALIIPAPSMSLYPLWMKWLRKI